MGTYYYRYTFSDDFYVISRGLTPQEIEQQESEHGKLIRTTYEGGY